jgi:3D (Asp-Asp-Asp) domain-containing protein
VLDLHEDDISSGATSNYNQGVETDPMLSRHLFSPKSAVLCACLLTVVALTATAQTAAQTAARPASQTGPAATVSHPAVRTHLSAAASDSAKAVQPVSAEPKVAPAQPRLNVEGLISSGRAVEAKAAKFAEPDAEPFESDAPPQAFSATAYNLKGRTASGQFTKRGVIAADPRVLPLGSVVKLDAGDYSGVYTVRDTGGVIKGRKIDVWMPSSREARTFGRRKVRLVVLQYGPGSKKKKR